jgi:hypothetical protein
MLNNANDRHRDGRRNAPVPVDNVAYLPSATDPNRIGFVEAERLRQAVRLTLAPFVSPTYMQNIPGQPDLQVMRCIPTGSDAHEFNVYLESRAHTLASRELEGLELSRFVAITGLLRLGWQENGQRILLGQPLLTKVRVIDALATTVARLEGNMPATRRRLFDEVFSPACVHRLISTQLGKAAERVEANPQMFEEGDVRVVFNDVLDRLEYDRVTASPPIGNTFMGFTIKEPEKREPRLRIVVQTRPVPALRDVSDEAGSTPADRWTGRRILAAAGSRSAAEVPGIPDRSPAAELARSARLKVEIAARRHVPEDVPRVHIEVDGMTTVDSLGHASKNHVWTERDDTATTGLLNGVVANQRSRALAMPGRGSEGILDDVVLSDCMPSKVAVDDHMPGNVVSANERSVGLLL